MLKGHHLRIARPTDQLEQIVDFYVKVLDFKVLGKFENHSGFDGVMIGHSDAPYHLEFTRCHGHSVGPAPNQDHLLVFYIPLSEEWSEMIQKVESAGGKPVPSFNPYWDRSGKTYEDPDGYRIVIQHGEWLSQNSIDPR